MCVHIEPTWYRPLDDDGEEYGDVLYFGCHRSGEEHEGGWLGSVRRDGDGWAWCARLASERPQRLSGSAPSEEVAKEIVEAFANADELACTAGQYTADKLVCAGIPACDPE